jgi:hypothetical protein
MNMLAFLSPSNGGALALLAIFGAFAFLFFIIGIVLYILASLGLYKMAVNVGIENPWLAWIPVANMYIIAKLIKTLSIGSWVVPKLEYVLPGSCIAVVILGAIPVIGTLLSLAYAVLGFFALHKLYKVYRPQNAVLWIVLSIILPFMGPIFIYRIRNDKRIEQ